MRGPLVRMGFEQVLETARRRTGLQEYGDPWFYEPLLLLLNALDTEANLTFIGRLAMRHDLVRLLSNRLRLVEDRRRYPEIAVQPIRQPIFIVGLPRTGSTLLHNLLSQDPENRVPFTWEVMFPSPPPLRDRNHDSPRIGATQKLLDAFDRLAPEFKHIHTMRADLPTECVSIMTHAFASYQFQSTCHVPSYQQWLAYADLRPAYEFHREVLQHLQWHCRGERWVLKAPAHTFGLKALIACYPDARFIQTHRDPIQVIGSVGSLDAILRAAFSDDIHLERIGSEAVEQWAEAASRVIAARDDDLEHRFQDVYYSDLVREPIETVRQLYTRLRIAWSEEVETRMRRFLVEHEQDGNGAHRYSLAQFGLTPDMIADRFHHYYRRFQLTPNGNGGDARHEARPGPRTHG